MTPAKKTSTGTKSAKKRSAGKTKSTTTKAAKPAAKSRAKPAVRKRSAAAPAAEPAAEPPTPERCIARTTKGTQCRLKPKPGSSFCARHQDAEATVPVTPVDAPAVAAAKNGAKPKATKAKTTTTRKPKADAVATETAEAPQAPAPAETDPETLDGDESPADEDEVANDEDYVLYGSVYSTTLEASPYDDQITPEMAEGSDDVDLVDENEMGGRPRRDRPERPKMTKEQAEAKALEKLGPRPNIAPEEDLDEELAAYDRRFRNEVENLLGGRRRRGRRGGRGRRGRRGGRGRSGDQGSGGGGGSGGSGGQGGGGRGGGGGKGRRGRGRGRRRGGQGGQGQGGQGGSRSGGAPKNVARDSPLANKRPSRGPKRGVQPRRRRRDPDV